MPESTRIAQVAHLKFPRWGSSHQPALRQRIERLRPREIMYGLNDQLPSDINRARRCRRGTDVSRPARRPANAKLHLPYLDASHRL
jgi:hypothetical protein